MKQLTITIFIILIAITQNTLAEKVYSLVPHLNIRKSGDIKSPVIGKLKKGVWAQKISQSGKWKNIKTKSGLKGFVSSKLTSNLWIKVYKKERKLFLVRDNTIIESYPIGLGFSPETDKIKQGDGSTPLGLFYICEMLKDPKAKYGARSMRISYPEREDARRGLKEGIITRAQYKKIIKNINSAKIPLQNTALGGSIRIHGGGSWINWTLGCIGMDDNDVTELFSKVPAKNCRVEIYRDENHFKTVNAKNYISTKIYEGAKNILKNGCSYTKDATAIIKIDFPMGDFNKKIGVCTDVAIRSLRNAGIDLQAEIYEDILLRPGVYPQIRKPNTNIDHRRTRNLKVWFDKNMTKLSNLKPYDGNKDWLHGDIVLMDTGVNNGTIYDHIGIVGKNDKDGIPLIINLWTIGYGIEEMNLLGYSYPEVVGHYRVENPYIY